MQVTVAEAREKLEKYYLITDGEYPYVYEVIKDETTYYCFSKEPRSTTNGKFKKPLYVKKRTNEIVGFAEDTEFDKVDLVKG